MKQERWRSGSVEVFEDYWRNIENHQRTRYSEGDIPRYDEYTLYLFNTLVEEFVRCDGPCLAVELGCGRGDTSLFFAKRGWQMVLLDISQLALDIAKRNFLEEDVSCLQVRAELDRAPFNESKFDVVMSFGVLEHFVDPVQPLREMVRILKPGGTLCASVVYTHRISLQTFVDWLYHIPGTTIKHAVLGRNPNRAWQMIRKHVGRAAGEIYENDLRMEDYISEMRKVGLVQVKAIPVTTIPYFRLSSSLESLYIRCVEVFCGIKRRVTMRHPLRALWGARRELLVFGEKPPSPSCASSGSGEQSF